MTLPKGRLTVVTGVSGSARQPWFLKVSSRPSLPKRKGRHLPPHVTRLDASGIHGIKLIDASPIGINVRSTVATYADVHDELRKVYGRLPEVKAQGLKAGDFSYNTGSLRCPLCDGTGKINLDVQFLPDVIITCPECHGTRYRKEADLVKKRRCRKATRHIPCRNSWLWISMMPLRLPRGAQEGLGKTAHPERLGPGVSDAERKQRPAFRGGEAQRLKLASDMEGAGRYNLCL